MKVYIRALFPQVLRSETRLVIVADDQKEMRFTVRVWTCNHTAR
jgi:hypothetical protein